MKGQTRRKAIASRFHFADMRMLVVLFLLLAAGFLVLLALGAPLAVLAQRQGYNQTSIPLAAPKGDRINSQDRIEKSCAYLSLGTKTLGLNKSSEIETAQNPSSCFPAESIVQHRFDTGQTFTLHAFSGKYVQWQIPNSWLDELDSAEIRQLVDITDLLYAHYAELVQGEPSGTGLLTISVNPQDQGSDGVGCVGCKGIELSNGTLPDFKKDIHVPDPGGWLTHEMGHNFDIYDPYIGGYYADWGHAWTSVVQFYLPYYGRWGDSLGDGDDELARWLRKEIVPWDAMGSGASWARCVRNGGGCEVYGVTANDSWGGLVLRFARMHKVSAFRRVFDYLRDYKASHPTPPATLEAKNDLLVMALAAGARMNISCELDTWHWEFSQSVRSQLALSYPGQDSFCLDADGDGYSPVRGDLNDNNASVHPGAAEVMNGIDDDCDGFVDDVHVTELSDFTSNIFQAPTINSSLPMRITGHASTSDQDAIRVRMGKSLYLKASLRSYTGLQGEFDLGSILNGGAGWGVFNFLPNSVTNFDVNVPIGSDGMLAIKPDSASSGNYEIILQGSVPRPPNPVQLATSSNSSTGAIQIVATTNLAPVDGERPTNIRFWANGIGFIQESAAATTVSFEWTPPAGYCGSGISAQLLAVDHPISAPSPSNSETLANISTRSLVQTGDKVMIGGFIVEGTEPKRVIIRAIGPELAQYGVSNSLADPTLELRNASGTLIASNDNFQTTITGGIITGDQVQDIYNSGYFPSDPRESAIIADLPAGNYTAIVQGVNNTTGVALVEVYDLSPDNGSFLRNISTRSVVQTGDNVMIGGFIVKGAQPKKVIVRAIGPELTRYGVSDVLANPKLELRNGDGALIASNDDWQTTINGGIITGNQVGEIRSSGHAPTDGRESAIIADLPPGNYTAIVRGVDNMTGVALVEVYDLQ